MALGGRLSAARAGLAALAVAVLVCAGGCARKEPPPPPPSPTPDPCDLTTGRLEDGDVVPPVKVKDVAPAYPEAARVKGQGGTVTVEFKITPAGRPDEVKVTQGVSPEIDQAALDAVRQWEYRPSRVRGAPCPVLTRVQLRFLPSPEPPKPIPLR